MIIYFQFRFWYKWLLAVTILNLILGLIIGLFPGSFLYKLIMSLAIKQSTLQQEST